MSHARLTDRWSGKEALLAGAPHYGKSPMPQGQYSQGTYGQTAPQPGLFPGRGLFRRASIAPRRRRNRPLRLLGKWLLRGLLVAAVPVGVGIWLLTSPRFALAELAVTGTARVPESWVTGSLAPLAGGNLVRLPLARVHQQVSSHPWVAGVSIHKELPSTLRVEVEERRPVALVALDDELWYADSLGALIAPLEVGEEPDGLLVVHPEPAALEHSRAEGARPSRFAAVPGALAVVDELAREQPLWASGLIAVEALTDQDFEIETAALPFSLRVRAGSVQERGEQLRTLLPNIERRWSEVATADLRFSRRIVLESSEPSGSAARGRGLDQ